MLHDLERLDESLASTREALDLRRQLATRYPDAFEPELAISLNNLGLVLRSLGRLEESLDATQEAISLRRRLAVDRPEVFEPYLVSSLLNLSETRRRLRDHAGSVTAAHEALSLLAPFFQRYPAAFATRVTTALRTYREAVQAADIEPDPRLVASFEEVLRAAQEESRAPIQKNQ